MGMKATMTVTSLQTALFAEENPWRTLSAWLVFLVDRRTSRGDSFDVAYLRARLSIFRFLRKIHAHTPFEDVTYSELTLRGYEAITMPPELR